MEWVSKPLKYPQIFKGFLREAVTLEIIYSKSAVKAINGMDKATKQRIKAGILGLTQKPPQGDIKPLQGFHDGRYRLRVGGYRIIYKFGLDNRVEILYILDIGPRGDIYK